MGVGDDNIILILKSMTFFLCFHIVNVECSVLLKMAAGVVPILLHGCRGGTT